MTRFKIIKHSNHRGSHGEVVGQADCSNAVADCCTKTGTHRISGRDRAGRKWSIEIGLDLFEQMQLNNALRGVDFARETNDRFSRARDAISTACRNGNLNYCS